MVTLEASHEQLERLVGEDLPIDELEDTLFSLGFELEGEDGDTLKIDITPDRPDLVSPHGMARQLRAYHGLDIGPYETKRGAYEVRVDSSVEDVRPHTACMVVTGISLTDEQVKELIWVQEKLHATFGRGRKRAAIGIYPMESITFPIRFKAGKPEDIRFTPLGEATEMDGHEILEKTSAGRAYGHLLEEAERYPYFIDAHDNILSVPPIINSDDTGRVTTSTKDVFVECSGHDRRALEETLNILAYLFIDMGGNIHTCTVTGPKWEHVTPDLSEKKRRIAAKKVNAVTGLELTAQKCADNLERMMHTIHSVKDGVVEFGVQPTRVDVWHDVDIIDDIVRAYGVNNIEPELPAVATEGEKSDKTRFIEHVRELLLGLGLQEVNTFALSSTQDQFTNMRAEANDYLSLGKAEEERLDMVRRTLLPEVLKALKHNRSAPYPQNVFEIADVVVPDQERDVRARNNTKIVLCFAGPKTTYTDAKATADYLFTVLEENVEYEESEHPSFLEGRCANISGEAGPIGVVGELHPEVLENLGLEMPVAACELDVDLLA